MSRRHEGGGRGGWALLWGALILLSPSLARADFSLELQPFDPQPGAGQGRNFSQADHRDSQCVRVLPPSGPGVPEKYLLVVRVPDSWPREGQPASPSEIAAGNLPRVEILNGLLRQHGWLGGDDPLGEAVRIVSLLRPAPAGDKRCPVVAPRYSRIRPLWEVLFDAECADSLSSAFSALQVLRSNGIGARLARYPSPSDGVVFGVLLPGGAQTLGAPWAYPVGADFLLPMHPSLAPGRSLGPRDLTSWSWEDVQRPGWSPTTAAPALDPPPAAQRTAPPDLCQQARGLGSDCGEAERRRGYLLNALSTVLLLALLAWAAVSWRERRKRLARVKTLSEEARKGRFG